MVIEIDILEDIILVLLNNGFFIFYGLVFKDGELVFDFFSFVIMLFIDIFMIIRSGI
jgi:hypothetical protein